MRWTVKQVDQNELNKLVESLNISGFLARLLINRGIKEPEEALKFLNPSKEDLHDPFLLKDMTTAVDILVRARNTGKMVLVYGDYDVDGITGAVVLKEFLQNNGWNVSHYIPKRMDEGYGLQPGVLEHFRREGAGVLLTVDCGVTAVDAVRLAKTMGYDVVITDHHETGEVLPAGDAILDPKRKDDEYPFKDLAGVGVAFKLISAIASRLRMNQEEVLKYLDLVALGTIADMVKLIDENRFIVKEGLERMKRTDRPGLAMLLSRLQISEPDSRDIGFRVAPKINAAGRLDAAHDAFDLLTTRDYNLVVQLIDLLFEYNATRQEIEAQIFENAVEQIERGKLDKRSIIVVRGREWHVGVIGIVAARLCHRYNKPVIVISEGPDGARASARSVPGVNLIDVLQPFLEYFEEFGGHSLAVGFSLNSETVDYFIEALRNYDIPQDDRATSLEVDAVLKLEEIDEDLVNELRKLEPFGHGNPEPLFLCENVKVETVKLFGQNQSNVKLIMSSNGKKFEATGFGIGHLFGTNFYEPMKMNMVFTLRGKISNLYVVDAEINESALSSDYVTYQEPELKHRLSHLEEIIPDPLTGNLLVLDLRFRNAFFYWLFTVSRKKCAVISMNNILSMQLYYTLLRYIDRPIDYLNSLNFQPKTNHAFMTLSYFLANLNDAMKRYDLFVINELALLGEFRTEEQVTSLFNVVSTMPERFLAISVKRPDWLYDLAAALNLVPVYERVCKPTYGLIDAPGQLDTFLNDTSCVLFSNSKNLAEFYKKCSILGQNVVVYSHSMKIGQKLSVLNFLKKKKPKLLLSSTNTDGLPNILGEEAQIIMADSPLTLFEILDAVPFEGTFQLLSLNFTESDVSKRKHEIEELFPNLEFVGNLLHEMGRSMRVDEFLDVLVVNGYARNRSYAKILLHIFKELGAREVEGKLDLSFVDVSRTSLRLSEGELERQYFERFVENFLAQRAKGIYRALSNPRVVI
ncbi:single-stranded-DNA-specific exonuclease RecJ [Pseudothermotoga sp.]|nr:single-stranded-DNA-specific exonuclease RecJ [Pseudothermotoga sp.]MDW8139076.1 single-stranded-DNA-specific exonuclease RecJ [Pseudothermotoga sp.]